MKEIIGYWVGIFVGFLLCWLIGDDIKDKLRKSNKYQKFIDKFLSWIPTR